VIHSGRDRTVSPAVVAGQRRLIACPGNRLPCGPAGNPCF